MVTYQKQKSYDVVVRKVMNYDLAAVYTSGIIIMPELFEKLKNPIS